MKLFDLDNYQRRELRRLAVWHMGYLLVILFFFCAIFYFDLFKSRPWLNESHLFIFQAPIATALFCFFSPWRCHWWRALSRVYERLEGGVIFCVMATMVFGIGFYIYSVFLWGLGALLPAVFYM
ncbi:MAG: hypothetical protein LBV77_05155 [Candidatus Adiutrix intracellularis]|jgi:hypothetical protein|nr:hypothetical protein [Candidatus Adiutrix intracellularis]